MSMDIDVARYDQEMALSGEILDKAVESFRKGRYLGASDPGNAIALALVFQERFPAYALAAVLVAAVRRLA